MMKFQKIQRAFVANVRDPKNNPPPEGVSEERMAVYQRLMLGNVQSTLEQNFPVIHKTLEADHWDALTRDFFMHHQAKTPIFFELPEEFLDFLEHERDADQDPVWLLELAHYEWVELALSLADESIPDINSHNETDYLKQHPVISPLAWLLHYQYPVQTIGPHIFHEEDALAPSETFLIVYRNREDHVNFMEVNAVTARLVQLLEENESLSGESAMKQLAEALPDMNIATLTEHGLEILQQLHEVDIVLGSSRI